MSLTDAFLLDPYPFETFVAVRTDGLRGCGLISDPWDGSTAERFDEVMREHVQPGTRVHLGPGNYETSGYSPGLPVLAGWQAKPNVTIVGAGIEATTISLRLDDSRHGRQVFAVGHDLSTGLGIDARANPGPGKGAGS